MKLKKSSTMFMRLRTKYLSSKAIALFVINKKLKTTLQHDSDFGKLTDIQLNRQQKNMTLELEHLSEINTIAINGYTFENRKGEPYLIWRTIDFTGPAKDHYKMIFKNIDGIELSKKYIAIVEAVL
ncbi:MAG: hypothetical protein COA36_09795 [Desulfotalea sp.]|nr:MAG: hypothetical protein COA36_09795 [Desulfotalea sp.]